MKYVKSEGDTEFKNELRKGNYVVRAPAMKTSWVVALWIGWEIQSERIQSSLSSYGQSRDKDTDSRGGMEALWRQLSYVGQRNVSETLDR